ncbi:MAG: pstA, partial [Microbacterium sp.]|nr:pstA [Microbacterium sp.]
MTLLDEPAGGGPSGWGSGDPHRTRRPAPRGAEPAPPRRRPGKAALEDGFDVVGALLAAGAVATLLFGWLTPMSGGVGWAVVAFLVFVVAYATLVSMRSDRLAVADRVMTALLWGSGFVVVCALAFVVIYTIFRGVPALSHLNFFGETMRLAGPLDPLDVGGIVHAIVGTLIQIGIALVITVPLGITTAVFLNEIGG